MFKRLIKKPLAFILTLALIGGILPGPDFALVAYADTAAASGSWADDISVPVYDDVNKIYTIDEDTELAWVADQVNNHGVTFGGVTFNITDDIDLSEHYWAPIGTGAANSFQGIVQGDVDGDGTGIEISGLTIGSAAYPDTTYTYAGLFGYIKGAAGTAINNVALKNAAVYASNTTYIGGLAAYMDTGTITISGCSVTGYICNSSAVAAWMGGLVGFRKVSGNLILTVLNSWSQCMIYSGYLGNTGGLIGEIQSAGIIKNCFATGMIRGEYPGTAYPSAGGLVGYMGTPPMGTIEISNCFSNCVLNAQIAYVGGIAGHTEKASIKNVYEAGTIINGSSGKAGELIGRPTPATSLTNCYYNGSTPLGNSTGITVTYIYTIPVNMTSFCDETLNPLADSITGAADWVQNSGLNGGFPYLDLSGDGAFPASVPLLPTVVNPVVNGTLEVGQMLSRGYTFLDINNRLESGSAYQWYRADSGSGSGAEAITGAANFYYTLTLADTGKYIYYVVTPSNGSETGVPVTSAPVHVPGGSGFAHGEGTSGEPYWIESPDDFAKIPLEPNACYLLTDNLTLNSVICTGTATKFTGDFDGDGKTVTLAIDDSGQYAGMFGVVGGYGNIHDLNVTGNVSGTQMIGGIAASNKGAITNCTSSAIVIASGGASANVWAGGIAGENSGQITGCTVTGTVGAGGLTGTDSYTAGFGGIAGHNYYDGSAVNNINCRADLSSFSVGVSGFGTVYAGGIAGKNDSAAITGSYTENGVSVNLDSGSAGSGVMAGGIAGYTSSGSISNCFAIGDITGSGIGDIYAGGLAGQCAGGALIHDNFYSGDVSGTGDVGGLVGYLDSAAVSYCYSAGSVAGTGEVNAGGLAGYSRGTLEYCYSNSYGTSTGMNGGLYGGHDGSAAVETGCYWNRDNTGAAYPTGASLSAIQMTDTNALTNMPGLFPSAPRFVTRASTVTERYFPQLVVFTNSADQTIRDASLDSATMAYYIAPYISGQPSDQTVTIGGTAGFTVTVTAGSGAPTYQWKKDGSNLTNGIAASGATISGATSSTLTITGAQKADEGSYICYISDGAVEITSSAVTLTVNLIPPSITAPPTNQTVSEGGTANFTVAATGSAILSYQWNKGGTPLSDGVVTGGHTISGATSTSLTISHVQMTDAGSYTCYISNSAGNVSSAAVTLTVNSTAVPPTITSLLPGESYTANAGWIINFEVHAQGTGPLSYQWQKDGADLNENDKMSGITSSSLVIGNVQASDAGEYRCVVSNAGGSATSDAITLTVNAVPPTVFIRPTYQVRTAGETVSFSVQAVGSEPFIYEWRKDGSPLTDGGRISGATGAALTISGIQLADAGAYSCSVTNVSGTAISSSASLSVNTEPVPAAIDVPPVDQTVPEGHAALFTVEASGNTPLTYQWLKDDVPLENEGCFSGANTPALTVGNVIPSYAGFYSCVVTNAHGTATSAAAELIVGAAVDRPPTITTTSLPDGALGAAYSQTLAATGTPPITWSMFASVLPGGLSLATTGAITGTPMATGAFNFTVRAANGFGENESNLIIKIYNPSLSVSPGGVTFPAAAAGYGQQGAQEFTVKNVGTGTVTGLSASLASGAAFAISEGLSADSLGAGSTATVSVRPKTGRPAGAYADTLRIVGDNDVSVTADLSFTVNTATVHAAAITPAAMTFAAKMYKVAPDVQVFAIENTGTETITELSASLADGAAFEIGTPLSEDILDPGGTATLSVSPKAGLDVGTYADTLIITGNNGICLEADLSFRVDLVPSYTAEADPASWVFAAATVGYTTPSAQVFTIRNTGTGTISGITATLPDETKFIITEDLSKDELDPGETAAIRIQPVAGLFADTYADTLSIAGYDGISLTVGLSFTVNAAAAYTASITPSARDFIATEGYSDLASQVFTIRNTGTGTITGLQAHLGAGEFVFKIGSTGLSANSLDPGEKATISIRPKNGFSAGAHYTDLLTITGDPGITLYASLSITVNEAVPHTITVMTEGSGMASASTTSAILGASISLNPVPGSNYHLKEWQTTPSGLSIIGNQFTMPDEDVEVKAVFEPNVYSITVLAEGGGTVDTSTISAIAGTAVTLSAIANPGYHFVEWQTTPAGLSIQSDNSFTMPGENVTVKAIFEVTVYSITVQTEGSGMATVSTTSAVMGTAVTLSAIANPGHHFVEWQTTPAGLSIQSDNSFTMPGEDVVVKAIFEVTVYSITVQTEGSGTATASTTSAVMGTAVTLSAIANPGYHFVEWQTTPADLSIQSDNSFTMPGEDVTVKAIFEATSYSITVQNDGYGEATASAVSAVSGAAINLSAAPSLGYHFKEWQVISPAPLAITGNSFTMPGEDVVVKAIFEVTVYSITVLAEGGGTVDASTTSAIMGTAVTLSAIADPGRHFKEWQTAPAGLSIQSDNSFTMPDEDVTIKAIFEATTYSITVQNDGHGEATASAVSAASGAAVNLSAAPSLGYHFKEWQVISPAALAITGNTFTMPGEDVAVKAIFEVTVYSITVQTEGSGTAIASTTSAIMGTMVTLSAIADPGYHFVEWQTTPVSLSIQSDNSFTMPGEGVTLKAVFEADTSGESSSGGGSGTPSLPVQKYNAKVLVDGTTSTTLPVNVNKDTNSSAVTVGTQQGEAFAEGKNVVIDLPPIPDVNSNTLGIPANYLSGTRSDGALTLNTGAGSLTLPSNMLTGTPGIAGSNAEIIIGQGNKENLPKDVKNAIGDRPLISLALTLDGRRTDWSNPDAPVTVSIPYTPTPEELEHPESIVIWYIDGSGKAVCVKNGHFDPATGKVIVDITHFSDYAVVYNQASFGDVPESAWYYKAVSFIASRDITTGTGGGNFSPQAKLTRGQFIVMLMKAYELAPDTDLTNNFSDAGNTYYTGYLAAAKRLEITAGVGNNMFAPTKEITRQEMFTLLYNALKVIGRLPDRTAGKPLSDFSDTGEIASWAKEAMSLLVETGTVSGSDGKLNPGGTTTRAEMAQVLYNLLGI